MYSCSHAWSKKQAGNEKWGGSIKSKTATATHGAESRQAMRGSSSGRGNSRKGQWLRACAQHKSHERKRLTQLANMFQFTGQMMTEI